jgi:hypothetical protein
VIFQEKAAFSSSAWQAVLVFDLLSIFYDEKMDILFRRLS